MKIKKQLRHLGQVKPRVYKRFKMLCMVSLVVGGFSYLFEYTTKGVEQVQIEDHENQYGNFIFVDAGITGFEGRGLAEKEKYVEVSEDLCIKDKTGKNCQWGDKEYELYQLTVSGNGYIEEWGDVELCTSYILVPGTSLLNNTCLGIFYLIALGYLFFGIAIISDIFMEAIESITAQTKTIELWDKEGKQKCYIDVPVWNATVANLTLMALGSSAPEILLSVIGVMSDLEKRPPELGPSTIVGSAAFNLLVISALSIIAVGDEPKKVNDVGVFFVTSLMSMWAYIWVYICLEISTQEEVTLGEGWWTLVFFFLLIIFAFSADKLNSFLEEKKKTNEQLEEQDRQAELSIKKNQLRHIAKEKSESCVLEVAQGIQTKETVDLSDMHKMEIINLYKSILNTNDLSEIGVDELLHILQPDSLLERFAYRKRGGVAGSGREFVKLKGTRGQIDHDDKDKKLEYENELLGFKCLHYSVTESNGTVEISIIKKVANQELTFGYRTVEDSAKPPKDYTHCEEVITMKKRETETKIHIPIIDDDEWEPDLDFFVELYDPNKVNPETGLFEKLNGDDTSCKVTILDEDFPGCLGFEITDIRVSAKADKVDVKICRMEGADGTISCMLRTEHLSESPNPTNAIEFEDFVPKHEEIKFLHGENEKTVTIHLVQEKIPQIEAKFAGDDSQQILKEDESSEEQQDVIFKVKLENPFPEEVKISKKNVCLITIVRSEDEDKLEDERQKLLEFYMAQKNPTWSAQFKYAVMLGPSYDEDNLILEDVTFYDAMTHFCTIFWKVLFSTVPPVSMMGGKPAFVISLMYIGLVTAVVGEIATVLGCVLGIEQSVTAITLVALGTSLPDTFASMTAARASEFADSAIGNVTGSNSVNVFLGLGLPWSIASTYWYNKELIKEGARAGLHQNYPVPAGNVAFSVFVFLVVACLCFFVLIIRRIVIGGELGGPQISRVISAVVLISLWCLYILMSILQAQGIIQVKDKTG